MRFSHTTTGYNCANVGQDLVKISCELACALARFLGYILEVCWFTGFGDSYPASFIIIPGMEVCEIVVERIRGCNYYNCPLEMLNLIDGSSFDYQ